MRVVFVKSMIVNGVPHEVGDVVDYKDGRLLGALLDDGIAMPADQEELKMFRELQPRPTSWVTNWRVEK